jgi:hypothetical protein
MSRNDLLDHLGLPLTFPEFFPPQLEQYRRSLSESTDTPDEYAIAYMLAAGGTATGGNVSACVQSGWCVRANLFMSIIGFKGSGKSTLGDKVLAPLIRHEVELKDRAALMAEEECYDDDMSDGDDESDGGGRRRRCAKPPEPCVIANDCTGPAVLRLLERNERQLLVNPDELSTQFIRNTGGTDRQMWCELYDGRRRRRERASSRSQSVTLDAPYVCVLGGIQPSLFQCTYSQRGDDGLLDRLLLVGDGIARQVTWPRDVDDPALNAAWDEAVDRLLHIEERAADSLGEQVESRFTPGALEVCRRLEAQLNQLVIVIGVPESQYGIVAKLRQHAVKLALLHRCFRWAAGEFGEQGPLGDIDADDAQAAAAATLFFLGRWLIWRPELRGGGAEAPTGPVGLSQSPGDDPALQSLATVTAGVQRGISVIERLIRLLRVRGSQPVVLATLTAKQLLPDMAPDELRDACNWLVDNGHAEWLSPDCQTFRLVQPLPQVERGRRKPISTAKERVK